MTTNEDIIYYDDVHVYETSFSRKKAMHIHVYVYGMYVYTPFGLIAWAMSVFIHALI